MVPVLGSFADTGTVTQTQSSSLGLSLWNLQPLSSPNPFNTLMVHQPFLVVQQGCEVPAAHGSRADQGHTDFFAGARVAGLRGSQKGTAQGASQYWGGTEADGDLLQETATRQGWAMHR